VIGSLCFACFLVCSVGTGFRQPDFNVAAPLILIVDDNKTTVCLCYTLHDGHAQAGSFYFAGYVGLEYFVNDMRFKAGAVILNPDADAGLLVLYFPFRANRNFRIGCTFQRIAGVAHYVVQYLSYSVLVQVHGF